MTAPVQAHSLDIDPAVVPGVWERWVDVSTWPEDDPDTRAATLEAAPAVGVKGRVVPKGGPSSTIVITRCEPVRAFYLRTSLPLATMSFEHDLEKLDTGLVRMTHRLGLQRTDGGGLPAADRHQDRCGFSAGDAVDRQACRPGTGAVTRL